MRTFTTILLLLFSLPALAQTSVPPAALRTGTPDAAANTNTVPILAVYNGRFVPIKVGSNLTLAVEGVGLVLNATVTVPPSPTSVKPQMGLSAIRQLDGSWMVSTPTGITLSGPCVVFLNGIRQQEGVDFTRDGANPARVVPVPNTAFSVLSADTNTYPNIVLFDYPAAQ